MKQDRPVLVSYIVDLNILNVLLLIASMFPKLIKPFGIIVPVPIASDVIIKVAMILALLWISYGLLKLNRWGYWLMIAYNLIFLIISLLSIFKLTEQTLYNQSFIVSVMGLALTFSADRYFTKEYKLS